MIAPLGSATARAPFEKPEHVKVPLFNLLMSQFDPRRRWVTLDLGAASTAMLELLGNYRSHVEIADLVGCGGVDMLNTETKPSRLAEIAEFVLPPHQGTSVDFVFCWDLLNYLRPKAVSALMHAIAARSQPGTLAHGLVVYSDDTMPDRPGRYRPVGDGRLFDGERSRAPIVAPRYSPEDLGQMMGRFSIERGMLLANGMQEFLFRMH
jgi:hypothetical protein